MQSSDLIASLSYHKKSFSPTNQIIANFFIENNTTNNLSINEVAKSTNTSTASINRFSKKMGFNGYKEFLTIYSQNLIEVQRTSQNTPSNIVRKIHLDFLEILYSHFDSIGIKNYSSSLSRADSIYIFGFGKTDILANMFSLKVNDSAKPISYTSYLEHFIYLLNTRANSNDYIVIFYHHEIFKSELYSLIKTAKHLQIPILIVSLDADIEEFNFATSLNIYPYWKNSTSRNSTTMFYPFLAFIDIIGYSLQNF